MREFAERFALAYGIDAANFGEHAYLVRRMLRRGAMLAWENANAPATDELAGYSLPAVYDDHYADERFYGRWRLTIATVTWKLGQPHRHEWASIGEYVALWAIVHEAKYLMEGVARDGNNPDGILLQSDATYERVERSLDEFYEEEEDVHGTTIEGLLLAESSKDVPQNLSFGRWWRPLENLPGVVAPHPLTQSWLS